jgi:two-component system response regulator DegU
VSADRTSCIGIVLADDHTLFREGLAQLLSTEVDIVVQAQVSTGREALRYLEGNSSDVVVMDITMPDMDGIEATRELSRRFPQVAVLILSAHDDADSLFAAIQAGACGYLLKDTEPEEFAKSIRVVANGGSLISPYITPHLLQGIREMGYRPAEAERRRLQLSDRELEVLRELSTAKTPAQIARDLFISTKTVQNHMSNLYRKLGVTNRAEAVVKAAHLGLLPKA